MSTMARNILHALCHRAVTCGSFAPSVASARRLSSICASLVALSNSNHATDAPLLRFANDCVHQLTALLPQVPSVDPITDDVAVHILRVAKSGRGCISPVLLSNLFLALDERLSCAQIAQWPAPTLVLSLHAVAVSAPLESHLSMTGAMLYCAHERLGQLDYRQTAQLLWCVATVRATESHAGLWSAACRRLVRWSSNLTGTSRALVVEALFLSPASVCAARRELLAQLLLQAQPNGPSAAQGSNNMNNRSMNMSRSSRSDAPLHTQLLSAAHMLSAESLVALLEHMLQGPKRERRDVPHLTRELLRRKLWPGHTLRRIAGIISEMPQCDATEDMRSRLLDSARQEEKEKGKKEEGHDPVTALGTVCIALGHSEIHAETSTMKKSRGVVTDMLRAAHTTRDVVWDRYNGRHAATIAIALDRIVPNSANSTKNPNHHNGFGDEDWKMLEAARTLVMRFPASCDATSLVSECTAAIITLCEIRRGCDSARCIEWRTADLLLQRCIDASMGPGSILPPLAVLNMWDAAAPLGAGLDPLRAALLRHVAAAPARPEAEAFALRDLARLLVGPMCPLEAAALFAQRLSAECSAGRCVAPGHLTALVAAMEAIAARGDPEEVDRALMFVFARSLGEPAPLVRRVTFTIPMLARLFQCCRRAADVASATQAIVLELLEESCARAESMEELNCAAALLPQMEHGELRDRIARSLSERGKQMPPATTPKVQRALLVVYLQKAGVVVKEDLLEALRR